MKQSVLVESSTTTRPGAAVMSPWRRLWRRAVFAMVAFLLAGHATLTLADVSPLTVSGNQLLAAGKPASFAGNSLFWSNTGWGGNKYYNGDVVRWLKTDWKSRIVRVAMGVDDYGGYLQDPAANKARLKAVVDAAISNDLYVIIDWHSHRAESYQPQAVAFFEEMARTYGKHNHVIYEIYNEPLQVSWSDTIKPYAQAVVNAIRAIDPDNLIIVGTPNWSQDVDVASRDKVAGANIAYTLHFYAGSHGQGLRNKAQTALNNGAALFVTEWGSVAANGDGAINEAETRAWVEFMKSRGISHANWALNDKSEGASALVPGASTQGGWSNSQLTASGKLTKQIISTWPSIAVSIPVSSGATATFPTCASAASDPDRDGWGWEGSRSCRVAPQPAPAKTFPSCASAGSDPDGDGWGWENNRSCRVIAAPVPTFPICASAGSDPDGDGWGWENNRSCRVIAAPVPTFPICASAGSDPDGDGWGWENSRSCRVVAGSGTGVIIGAGSSGGSGGSASSIGFRVSGSVLLDAAGKPFIARGVNNPHAWFDSQAYSVLPQLAALGTNIIRVVWTTRGTAARLDQVLTAITAQKMISMVELHDGTGSNDAKILESLAAYWARSDVIAVLKKHERYLLVNIANEWGNAYKTEAQWANDYLRPITLLRNAGLKTTLVIDGPGWGQNGNAGLWHGQALLNHDPERNLLFAIHMYGSWNDANNIANTMINYRNNNLPLVIGEFGYNYNNGSNNLGSRVNAELLMRYAQQYNVGYIAWSTQGNDTANAWLDLMTNWSALTPWGNTVFNGSEGITRTARRASVFD